MGWYENLIGSKTMPIRLLKNSTIKVAELLQRAISDLAAMKKSEVSPEFILMALLEQKDSIFFKVCDELNVEAQKMRDKIVDQVLELAQTIPNLEIGHGHHGTAIKISSDVQKLFELAQIEKEKLGDSYISTAAILLAFFNNEMHKSKAILEGLNLNYGDTLKAVVEIKGNSKITQKDGESRVRVLDEYTIDITALARKGLLDPVLGREKEINRVIEILSRRKKSNPLLLGQPGVGKTVIVEGLAQQIATGDVPEHLLRKRILSLEIGTLIAGAKMQGEFEERIKSIRDEVIASAGDIILFMDEIHTVVGAGRSSGGLDASNMLKPALAKGYFQCIGATTLKEYKLYIESDKALERRFQQIKVEEPDTETAISILQGIKDKYERHHLVIYKDEAIRQAVILSQKYIENRQLPDKAIDLMDEAGSSKRIKVVYTPPEIRKKLALKQKLEEERISAFNKNDFEKMAYLQMNIADIDIELKEFNEHHSTKDNADKRVVDEGDIAEVIHKATGIPVQRIVKKEAEKLIDLEDTLKRRVVAQDHAIEKIAYAIRRNRSGLRNDHRPVASFIFLGPSGVGKTELAKALAEQLLDDDRKIIRIDMSEYMEKHSVSKLIGSPPGYIGYGEGGQLTEKIKHQPYSILLLDEFEKAHPDIFNLLLPVLDEGWLTDAEGQKVSFQNTLIIATSNIGAEFLSEKVRRVGIGVGNDEKEDTEKEVMKQLNNFVRPEFLNRLDDVIIFNSLNEEALEKIVYLHLNKLSERLKNLGIEAHIDQSVAELILKNSLKLTTGARPIKRSIETMLENEIASELIKHQDSSHPIEMFVTVNNHKIIIRFSDQVQIQDDLSESA